MPDQAGRILRLKDKNMTPPHGFTVRVPQTGLVINGGHLKDLVLKVQAHLIAANKPVPLPLDVWVEDLLASRLPPDLVSLRGGAAPAFSTVLAKGPRMSEGAALRATLQLLHAVRAAATAEGRALPVAGNDVAEKRTAVCKGCPEMTADPGCYSCTMKSVLDPWTGHRGNDDPALGSCHCDGALLKALVRSSGSGCNMRTAGVSYPKNCWRMDDGKDASAPAP